VTAVAFPRTAAVARVTQARVILSEWTKLRSVRSTRWSLLVATVLTIGFPILASIVISTHWGTRSAGDRANFNGLDPALIGSQIA
jgi:ABC-2 type transport system permease protein